MEWLIFLSQLPSNPSSLRVTVWRKMRAAGALGLQNGTWLFPHTPENEKFMRGLLELVISQGASGQIFRAAPLTAEIETEIIQRFQADRDQEYNELLERCAEFLTEIEKETRNEKFTFAELEEAEDDLEKLNAWQAKIHKRDFARASRADKADRMLADCREAFERFSRMVYERQDLQDNSQKA